jgi:hypothetical protein
MVPDPQRDLDDPDHWHVNGNVFSLRAALAFGWGWIEDACGVPAGSLRTWWERIRPRTWQEKFIEALADSERALKRRSKEGSGE